MHGVMTHEQSKIGGWWGVKNANINSDCGMLDLAAFCIHEWIEHLPLTEMLQVVELEYRVQQVVVSGADTCAL